MYDLNYTYLIELEVDTRQSFDDLSDDLLLLDKNAEESQVVDMKSAISAWQNYFWKSTNPNKQRLDVTFTDISIERGTVTSTDWQGNPLNDLEMMSIEELENFLNGIDARKGWAGGRTWEELSNALCDAIVTLQNKYVNNNNVYPVSSVLVTDENPNERGFGSWTSHNNCYLSEIFAAANYNVNKGYDSGSGPINDIGLTPSATTVPNHTHKISYIPATGSGGSSSEGIAATVGWKWSNSRRGLDPTYIGHITSHTTVTGKGNIVNASNAARYKYSGKPTSRSSKWHYTTTVLRDANSTVEGGGGAGAKFDVTATKVDPVDSKIKVAPKTYPLSANIWERTS